MKSTLFSLIALLLVNLSFAQVKYEYGDNFEFDTKNEQDPQFVLKDNYNHYMLTVVVVDGMMARRQMIVRKFDQKNQMLEKYVYDFPKFDIGTLYNYLGFTEANGKVAVFTQTYSNKAKKSVISVHAFDKATGQFATTELNSMPIVSAMKSGTVELQKSENGRNIGITWTMHQAKDEAEKNLVLVVEAATLNVNWQKEFVFTDKYTTKTFAVTNSGKVVFLRNAKGMKKHNYMVLASQEGQEEKQIESEIFLHSLKSISIGEQDYILAFNDPVKGIRSGDYNNLLMYDLKTGRIVQNAKVDGFGAKGTTEVAIHNVSMQNNEIHLFTEAKIENTTKPVTTATGTSWPVTTYAYGPAYLIIMNMDGSVKKAEQLNLSNTEANLHHSYGLVNIKGNYFIHTGAYISLPPERVPGLFVLNAADGYNMPKNWLISPFKNNPNYKRDNITYVHQLLNYFPDSDRLLFARIVSEKEMSLVNVFGVQ